jgi:hypothetical protein
MFSWDKAVDICHRHDTRAFHRGWQLKPMMMSFGDNNVKYFVWRRKQRN